MAENLWRFADCEFDALRRELRVGGTLVDLEAKPLEVLHQLLLRAGDVATKEELFEAVWPGLAVVDGSLATAVSKLRKALGGDDGLIVTVSKVGYRLGVAVERPTAEAPPSPVDLRLVPGVGVPGREQWRLTRSLGRSWSSEVWIAEHTKTRDVRVFKFAPDTARRQGLEREVTVSRLLRDSLGERPDFVRVLEWRLDQPPYFVESEHAGPNLVDWAAARGGIGSVPIESRLRMMRDIASAVAAAHSVDVLHLDLKPGNILVSARADGTLQVKIGDFGSAALLTPSRLAALGITNLGFPSSVSSDPVPPSGTPMYIAPEVLAGQTPTAASDVYALGLILYQFTVGDFRRPLAAGWEADVPDSELRDDIAAAASGDPSRRPATASGLVERLATLDERRARRESQTAAEARAQATARRRPWWAMAAALTLAVAAGLALYRRAPAPAPRLETVAVLPLRNLGAGAETDYLRLALADEAATILSHSRGVVVRPFAAAGGIPQPTTDLATFGRDQGVDTVLTGHFLEGGGRLAITLEAVDVETGRLRWRDSFDAPTASLMSAQVQMALRIRGGLAPALGAAATGVAQDPRNEEAYALFLRSTALASDPGPNREALALLEHSLRLDDSYAPAWHALSKRSYIEARYGTGERALLERGAAAAERAIDLDPDYVVPAAGLVVYRVERGDVAGAYKLAADLVRRHPDSVDTQFSLSYVYRYAGLLDDAARHCEQALLIDPRSSISGVRSCAVVFLLRGDHTRTVNYLHLDQGSEFERALSIDMLVRQRRLDDAIRLVSSGVPQWGSWPLLAACLQGRPAAEIAARAAELQSVEDAETNYFAAAHLAYCGQAERSAVMLRRAIEGGYCAFPAIDADPLLTAIRARTEYAALRSAAESCQARFLEATRAHQ